MKYNYDDNNSYGCYNDIDNMNRGRRVKVSKALTILWRVLWVGLFNESWKAKLSNYCWLMGSVFVYLYLFLATDSTFSKAS